MMWEHAIAYVCIGTLLVIGMNRSMRRNGQTQLSGAIAFLLAVMIWPLFILYYLGGVVRALRTLLPPRVTKMEPIKQPWSIQTRRKVALRHGCDAQMKLQQWLRNRRKQDYPVDGLVAEAIAALAELMELVREDRTNAKQ